MQKAGFLNLLKAYEETAADERDTAFLAECFVRYAATSAADKQALAERVWALLTEDRAPQETMAVFAGAFTASDTIRNVVKYRAQSDKARHVASFRASLMMRARRAILEGRWSCAEHVVQEKRSAFLFADLLNVRRPETHERLKKIEDIEFRSGIALKPPSGGNSNGVYLLRDRNTVIDLRRGLNLSSRRDLRAAMKDDIAAKRVPRDVWNVEELITDDSTPSGLAADWNFHCFYGEIVMMGHMLRYPKRMNYGLDQDMQPIKWLQPSSDILQDPTPRRPDPAFLNLARKLSLALPTPYVRIDLLTSNNGPVLGEMTARPGVIDQYDRETDRKMGDAFLRAEARLEADLLNGKGFDTYRELVVQRKAHAEMAARARLESDGKAVKAKSPKPLPKASASKAAAAVKPDGPSVRKPAPVAKKPAPTAAKAALPATLPPVTQKPAVAKEPASKPVPKAAPKAATTAAPVPENPAPKPQRAAAVNAEQPDVAVSAPLEPSAPPPAAPAEAAPKPATKPAPKPRARAAVKPVAVPLPDAGAPVPPSDAAEGHGDRVPGPVGDTPAAAVVTPLPDPAPPAPMPRRARRAAQSTARKRRKKV